MKSLLRMALLVVGRDSQQRLARTTNELILNNDEKWNSETNWVVWREAQLAHSNKGTIFSDYDVLLVDKLCLIQ